MIFFYAYFILYTFFFELMLFFDIFTNLDTNFYFILFFILFFYNIFRKKHNEKNINFDLITKYLFFLLKTPNFFFNYLINILKKIFLYLFYVKYVKIYQSLYIFYKNNFNFLFTIWKPLFKKSSYFGYYRSNRSKWIK